MGGAIGLVFAPALSLELTGDDYQMVQLATEIIHSPRHLLSPIGEFFRPVGVWTLALDRLVWGTDPRGYHVTTLVLHILAALLLVAVGRKLGLGSLSSWLVGLVWALSPFASEVAIWAAVRHEQTLFISWLVLILLWPGPEQRWGRWRVIGVAAALALGLLSKETWVVTPGIVALLTLFVERVPVRRAAKPVGLVAAAALVYVVVRFLIFPTFGGYYRFSLGSFSKLPQMLSAFLAFEMPQPYSQPLSWRGVLATIVTAGAIALAFRRRPATVSVGTGLLLLPLLPVLPVPYLPARYMHIPYAGFLLIAASAVVAIAGEIPRPARTAASTVGVLGLAVLVTWEVTVTRATLADWKRVSEAHRRLLSEAQAFAPSLPIGRPIVLVRGEDDNPLLTVARSTRGMPQLWFPRHDDPDGLIDAAALFEWCIPGRNHVVREIDDWERRLAKAPGGVVVHTPDSFRWVQHSVPDVAMAAARYRDAGLHIRVVELER
jgi:hypothetical protein